MSQWSAQEWHARFQTQAQWTADLRKYLFPRADLSHAQRILEVGSGTGAITSTLHESSPARIFGLDCQLDRLILAHQFDPRSGFIAGDARQLPFPDAVFDLAYCHFFLLWVADPLDALVEMRRVVRPGGSILALAEPDYGGRIDYPAELSILGQMQADMLRAQGAEPNRGRQLASLFQQAGLSAIEVGVLGGQWQIPLPAELWAAEWAILTDDLHGRISAAELTRLHDLDLHSQKQGDRLLYIPTFYAWGQTNSH